MDFNTMRDYILITARDVHTAAKEAGWWTDINDGSSLIGKRDFISMGGLIVTEITEAADGFYLKCMDDKLPHRPQVEVELGDAFIRMGDTSFGNQVDLANGLAYLSATGDAWDPFECEVGRLASFPEKLLRIINYVSYAIEGHRKRDDVKRNINMAKAMIAVLVLGAESDLDIRGAIAEKVAFNKVRPDHKIENRRQEGGKKE